MAGMYSDKNYRRLRAKFRDHCHRNRLPCAITGCGEPIDYTLATGPDCWQLDHHIPRSIRPDLFMTWSNFRPSHKRCNRAKSAQEPGQWVAPSW